MKSRRFLDFLFTPWVMLLGLLLAYPVVIAAEWGITWGPDKYLRWSGAVPEAYLERLPDPIGKRENFSDRLCERNRVGLLWEYQVCLRPLGDLPDCGNGRNYVVAYWPPPLNSIPFLKGYYFGTPVFDSLMVIDERKQPCQTRFYKTDE